ncbi:hypothetical protein F4818DRAFT_133400 [Hypoxylon cercidicola]|nr:hypothetical protein F4818DRAFT_133400 [Hypoxylon cercidicola]
MSDPSERPEVPRGSSPSQRSEGGPSRSRGRYIRTPGMPEEEKRARQQRRRRFRGFSDEDGRRKNRGSKSAEMEESNMPQETVEQGVSRIEPKLTEIEAALERKPWESIVIGADLGENLSHIETKNREIAQQRYIIEYHEKHSPHEVPHQQTLLEELIRERAEMPDNEENKMPEDQREERKRIDERLDLLNWGLETCQCEAEEVNIRAAIEGYRSNKIPYSNNYTLIYAGHIVDFCPTYRSFCRDRQERLDLYFAKFGPGWLWHEPPLSGTGAEPLAKKGVCLDRYYSTSSYNIGSYHITMRFTVDKSKVSRGGKPFDAATQEKLTQQEFRMLLDSGATFPLLSAIDLRHLDVDLRWHPAQGITRLATLDSVQGYRFFEMTVSARANDGGTIIGEGDLAVWPEKLRILGGLYPVCINTKTGKTITSDRLSGMVPFEACYMSSAPTRMSIWIGEDRRDVLGSSRLPPHMRYDSENQIRVVIPDESLEKIRSETTTPDRVTFEHRLNSQRELYLTDTDLLGVRGKSQLMVVERESQGPDQPPKTTPRRGVILEPRRDAYTEAPPEEKAPISLWRKDLLNPEELESRLYTNIQDQPAKKRKRTETA